jgi:hypothetical protein
MVVARRVDQLQKPVVDLIVQHWKTIFDAKMSKSYFFELLG